jgi:hypothetical protein
MITYETIVAMVRADVLKQQSEQRSRIAKAAWALRKERESRTERPDSGLHLS